jgi:hypothetical protein
MYVCHYVGNIAGLSRPRVVLKFMHYAFLVDQAVPQDCSLVL